MHVPSSSIPHLSASTPIPVSFLDDDNEEENPSLPIQTPPKHEHAPTTQFPRWVCSTQEAAGDLASDPSNQCHTHSSFQPSSSLLA
jgi:hypothetical protein